MKEPKRLEFGWFRRCGRSGRELTPRPMSANVTEVLLPQLGESVVEGTITKWLVKEGDVVTRDQPLVVRRHIAPRESAPRHAPAGPEDPGSAPQVITRVHSSVN